MEHNLAEDAGASPASLTLSGSKRFLFQYRSPGDFFRYDI